MKIIPLRTRIVITARLALGLWKERLHTRHLPVAESENFTPLVVETLIIPVSKNQLVLNQELVSTVSIPYQNDAISEV